jgi:hypothetical protein
MRLPFGKESINPLISARFELCKFARMHSWKVRYKYNIQSVIKIKRNDLEIISFSVVFIGYLTPVWSFDA